MEIIILPTPEDVGRVAAALIARVVTDKPDAVLGLATGSSPLDIYRSLAARVADGSLDVSQASGFALDEYVGIPLEHPESYAAVIARDVVGPLGMDPDRVRVPDGRAADLEAATREYDEAIAAAGGVDIQILGIGANGHIGFNEPTSSFASRTRIKTLAPSTREANARFFDSARRRADALPDAGARHDPRREARRARGAGARQGGGDRSRRRGAALGDVPRVGAAAAPARDDRRRRGCGRAAHPDRLLQVHLREQAGVAAVRVSARRRELSSRGADRSSRWAADHLDGRTATSESHLGSEARIERVGGRRDRGVHLAEARRRARAAPGRAGTRRTPSPSRPAPQRTTGARSRATAAHTAAPRPAPSVVVGAAHGQTEHVADDLRQQWRDAAAAGDHHALERDAELLRHQVGPLLHRQRDRLEQRAVDVGAPLSAVEAQEGAPPVGRIGRRQPVEDCRAARPSRPARVPPRARATLRPTQAVAPPPPLRRPAPRRSRNQLIVHMPRRMPPLS